MAGAYKLAKNSMEELMVKKMILIICSLVIYISASVFFIDKASEYINTVEAVTYQEGSSGSDVANIQRRLSEVGLYSGNIDGVFGPMTTQAVIDFQLQRGIVADGIVGDVTLERLGLLSSAPINEDDLYLLAAIIYGEGRGEPYEGQVAIGAVVLNRVESDNFPDTIYEVIYQNGAFTAVSDGQIYLGVNESTLSAARDALNGADPTGGALYYWNPETATSQWIWSIPIETRIGRHVFGGSNL